MKWKILKTKEQYHVAATRLMEIFHAEPGTSLARELYYLCS